MAGSSSKIPVEIISDDEMASIEAAFASAVPSIHSSASTPQIPSASIEAAFASAVPAIHSFASTPQIRRFGTSIQSVPVQAKRRLFTDIEDCGSLVSKNRKKFRAADTLLQRFRSKRGLFVTDVTKTEWCEKQMEFSLFAEEWKNNEADSGENFVFGRGTRKSEAMKAGTDRHFQLLQEVLTPVKVKAKSCEDYMALKLVNFINGVNQLLSEGLTRELPIVSFDFTHGIWMVGMVDEIRKDHNPVLVEIKTRYQDTVPSEAQKRNGMIQLMCYKYLWDNLVSHADDHQFPSKQLFNYFELNPRRNLCEDLQKACSHSGISALTLNDVVMCYKNACKMLPLANDQLVLRYESQRDHSVLDEEKFGYDDGWIKSEIKNCLQFWLGHREAEFVDEEERWKCGYCDFAHQCPAAYIGTDSCTETFSEDYDSSDYSEM